MKRAISVLVVLLLFVTIAQLPKSGGSNGPGGGGGSGTVQTIAAGILGYLTVDNTDPANPIIDGNPSMIQGKTTTNIISGYDDLGGGSLEVPNSTTLPGSCNTGQIYQKTDAPTGQQIYGCEGGAWVLQGGSSQLSAPTYLWSDYCRKGSMTTGAFGLGWLNINGDFLHTTAAAIPPCSVAHTVTSSPDTIQAYVGDGGDKVMRFTSDWDFIWDATLTDQNTKEIRLGVLNGTTTTNDGCWLKADRVDGTTTWKLYCRAGGVNGTETSMTGNFITATRSTYRIRRSGNTVYGSINSGTEFSTTSSVSTTTNGAAPHVIFINDGGASPAATIYYHSFGMKR